MFRKPKRSANKTALRRKDDDEVKTKFADGSDDDDDGEPDTSELLAHARSSSNKKLKTTAGGVSSSSTAAAAVNKSSSVMHTFNESSSNTTHHAKPSEKDLAVSSAAHHSATTTTTAADSAGFGADGIFRDATRNKFHAGPLRAAQNVRVTARFDYQPDICKDYKQTGFCGFGDTCIYLHDRGDTLSGWQLEEQWQQQQQAKKQQQEVELDAYLKQQEGKGGSASASAGGRADLTADDGLPFACYLCRQQFDEPVVTNCQHYFCQACILKHVRENSEACPICGKDTFGVFNEPAKLIAKKRKLLGAAKAKEDGSWEAFYKLLHGDKDDGVNGGDE